MSPRTGGGGRHRRHERMRSADPSRSAQAISYSGGFHPGLPRQLMGGQVSVCTQQWHFCNWHGVRREWVSALLFALDVSHQSIDTSPQERLLENLIVVQWWDLIRHTFLISSAWFLFFLGLLQLNPFLRRCGVFIVDLLNQLSRFAFTHYCNVSWHDPVSPPPPPPHTVVIPLKFFIEHFVFVTFWTWLACEKNVIGSDTRYLRSLSVHL